MKNLSNKFLVLISLVVLACSSQLVAQTSQSTGSTLRGQVVDELEAIIPGAKVTIVLPGGKTRVVTAGGNGEFAIPNVPPGVYNFYVEMKEFKPFVITDLKIPYTDELKVMMKVADVEIATDVVADANGVSVEPDQNLTATVLDENFIKDLPNNEDDLRDVLQALAGPGAGASGNGQAEIMVNGFRGGRLPPKDAIMKITINQNPYSAEFSQPGFGRIEITTKPGNDNWRGSFGLDYRNSATDARNAFALTRPELDQQNYRFNLSGPIIKKKMSFFANVERRMLDGGNNTNAILPTGPFAANVLAPNNNTQFSVRADYLINQKNTLGVSYNRSQSNAENTEFAVRFGGGFGGFGGGGGRGGGGGGFGGGGGGGGAVNFTLPERATNSRNASNDLQTILTTILSSRLINEARVRMGYDTRNTSPLTDAVAISVLDAFNGGGSPSGISNNRGFDYEIQNYLTYTLKKHTLKGGVQIQYAKTSNFSTSNFNGTYTFPSLGEYCRIAGVACDTSFASGAASNATRAYQFRVNTGDPRLRYDQYENSWFINDDFRFSQTFTLSLGVRQEWQTNLRDSNNIMPRIGAAWSPFKDRKTSFRFGAGMFYQRLSDSLFGNTLRVNGQTQVSYIINNPIFNPNFRPGSPLPGTATQVQNTTISILASDLQAPASYNVNASVERQLPWGLMGSANFVYFRGVHQFRTRNINARGFRDISTCAPPAAGQQPNIDCTRPDPTKGDINQTESSAASDFKALFIRVDRRMGKNFSFFANYSLMDMRNNSEGLPANNYNLAGEWGRASFMSGHSGFIMGRISLPKGIGLNPMVNLRTGNPYNIILGTDANGDNNFNDRPAGITRNADLPSSLYSQITGCRTGRLVNGACVISTPNPNVPGAFINTPGQSFTDFLTQNYPNGVRAFGPGAVNVNLNISKSFGFGKRDAAAAGGAGGGMGGGRGGGMGGMGGGGMRGGGMGGGMMGGMMGGGGAEGARYTLQLTAQVTNILNRVNFGQYSGTLTSPNFGRSISASSARQIEFGMRFSF